MCLLGIGMHVDRDIPMFTSTQTMQSWTILLAYPSTQEFHRYPFPTSVWRVVLWLVALGLLLFQIGEEVHEVIWGKLKHKVSLDETDKQYSNQTGY